MTDDSVSFGRRISSEIKKTREREKAFRAARLKQRAILKKNPKANVYVGKDEEGAINKVYTEEELASLQSSTPSGPVRQGPETYEQYLARTNQFNRSMQQYSQPIGPQVSQEMQIQRQSVVSRNASTQETTVPQSARVQQAKTYQKSGLGPRNYNVIEREKRPGSGVVNFEGVQYDIDKGVSLRQFEARNIASSGEQGDRLKGGFVNYGSQVFGGIAGGAVAVTTGIYNLPETAKNTFLNPIGTAENIVLGVGQTITEIKARPVYGVSKLGTVMLGGAAEGQVLSKAGRAIGFKPVREKLFDYQSAELQGTAGKAASENILKIDKRVLAEYDSFSEGSRIKVNAPASKLYQSGFDVVDDFQQRPSGIFTGRRTIQTGFIDDSFQENVFSIKDTVRTQFTRDIDLIGESKKFTVLTETTGGTTNFKILENTPKGLKFYEKGSFNAPKPPLLTEPVKAWEQPAKTEFSFRNDNYAKALRTRAEGYTQEGLFLPDKKVSQSLKVGTTYKAAKEVKALPAYSDVSQSQTFVDFDTGTIKADSVKLISEKYVPDVVFGKGKAQNIKITQEANKLSIDYPSLTNVKNTQRFDSSFIFREEKPVSPGLFTGKKGELELINKRTVNIPDVKAPAGIRKFNTEIMPFVGAYSPESSAFIPGLNFQQPQARTITQRAILSPTQGEIQAPAFSYKPAQRQVMTSEVMLDTRKEQSNRQEMKQVNIQDLDFVLKQSHSKRLRQGELQITRQAQALAQDLQFDKVFKQEQVLVPKLQMSQKVRAGALAPVVPMPAFPVLPFLSPQAKGRTPGFSSWLQPAYDVQVRRKGKFKTVKSGLTKLQALGFGQEYTDRTVSRTFKLHQSGVTMRKAGGFFNPFRYKQKGSLYIEKSKFAISTGGEKGELRQGKLFKSFLGF